MKPEVHVFTDGSVYKGAGGWAVRVIAEGAQTDQQGEIFGGEVTSQQAEMIAVIAGLHLVRRPSRVIVHTDDRTMIDQWRKFLSKGRVPIPAVNVLWQQVKIAVGAKHILNWRYVQGHTGNIHNESCHVRAKRAAYGAWESQESKRGNS